MLQLWSRLRLSKEHNTRGQVVVTIFTCKYNNGEERSLHYNFSQQHSYIEHNNSSEAESEENDNVIS